MEDENHAMETVDSTRDRSVPLMISNSKLLDCCICFQPLSIPVFQCDNGHIVCSTCFPKLKNKCQKCSLRISSKRCKVVENILSSVEMPCRNAKHGCREKISYIGGNRKHEEECIHQPCYCPFSGCDFAASSEVLSNHEVCITPMMQIYIKNLMGKTYPLRVNSSDTIVNVKLKIQDMDYIPVHHQRLVFRGKQLDDNMTIANYNIEEKSTIHVFLRCTGN